MKRGSVHPYTSPSGQGPCTRELVGGSCGLTASSAVHLNATTVRFPKLPMPLHTFMSPNGNGLCAFEAYDMRCGQGPDNVIHLADGELIASHDWVPPTPGTIGEQTGACFFDLADGGLCGAQPQNHANLAGGDPVAGYLEEKGSAAYTTHHGAVFPVDDPPTTAQVVAMFHDNALRLAVAKNAAYADAWRRQGYIGNVARVLSKVERLRNLVWQDNTWLGTGGDESAQDEETLRDTLLDLANLAAFAAANLAAGNKWGDRRG